MKNQPINGFYASCRGANYGKYGKVLFRCIDILVSFNLLFISWKSMEYQGRYCTFCATGMVWFDESRCYSVVRLILGLAITTWMEFGCYSERFKQSWNDAENVCCRVVSLLPSAYSSDVFIQLLFSSPVWIMTVLRNVFHWWTQCENT